MGTADTYGQSPGGGPLKLFNLAARGPHRPFVCKISKLNTKSPLHIHAPNGLRGGEGGLNLGPLGEPLPPWVSCGDFFSARRIFRRSLQRPRRCRCDGTGTKAANTGLFIRALAARTQERGDQRHLFSRLTSHPPGGRSKVWNLSIGNRVASAQTFPRNSENLFLHAVAAAFGARGHQKNVAKFRVGGVAGC